MSSGYQTTLYGALEFEGLGIHKGHRVKMRLEPADAGSGISFDFNGRIIPAIFSNASITARNTELSDGVVTLYTVEHVLSALKGMGVDNAVIIMDAEEPPALDGSAAQFAAAIHACGIVHLAAPRKNVSVESPILVHERDAIVLFLPADNFRATYILDHPHPKVGRQVADFHGGAEEYLNGIAPARTFGLIEEVEALRAAGLALGGSVENAVVVYPDHYSSPLKFDDEFARHKLLDFVGDVSLCGCHLNAHCIGIRSGHAANIKGIRKLADALGF